MIPIVAIRRLRDTFDIRRLLLPGDTHSRLSARLNLPPRRYFVHRLARVSELASARIHNSRERARTEWQVSNANPWWQWRYPWAVTGDTRSPLHLRSTLRPFFPTAAGISPRSRHAPRLAPTCLPLALFADDEPEPLALCALPFSLLREN